MIQANPDTRKEGTTPRALLSLLFFAAIAAAPLSALPAGAFTLLKLDAYAEDLHPLPGRSGRDLLRSLCFRPPGACSPDGNACSIAPYYPAIDVTYGIGVTRVAARAGRAVYRVDSVTLGGRHRIAPIDGGKVVMWRELRPGSKERRLVWSYLRKHASEAEASLRLRALDWMQSEIRWHEYQHVRHLNLYFRAFERVVNDPRYPRRLSLRRGEDPRAAVEKAIERDRDARIRKLSATLDRCLARFHARELRPTSFSTLIGECACYGGASCRTPLPAFPPPDFECEF